MIERPRGTRDFDPDEMEIRHKIEDKLREVSRSFGYREVLTPTFEHTKLFKEKSGPSIVEELYAFEDKGGREIALRPEFTAPVMRMYAQGMREYPKPIKIFYFGPTFRYERPQSGRYREFWQFGTEIIGPDNPRADAENIALAYECFKKIGLDEFKLKISNLKILDSFLENNGIDKKDRTEIYHGIDKGEIDSVSDKFNFNNNLEKLLTSDIEEMRNYLVDKNPVDYLEEVLEALSYYGIDKEEYYVDLKTVRGLDYYKGIVFEIDAKNLGAEKQVCGGGDYHLGDIFDLDISSKGFALGFDRSILALKKEGKLPKPDNPRCFIIPIGEESFEYSYNILKKLRENNITTDIELMGRNIGNALGYADKNNYEYSLLIGGDEIKENTITIKKMKSGEQKTIDKKKILQEVE